MLSIKQVLAYTLKQVFTICFLVAAFLSVSVLGQTQKTEKPDSLLANQQINNVQSLKLNQPIKSQIKGGETHSFQFVVKAGFYARVEVEQQNIDVVVSLFTPDGKLVVEMDGKNGRLWREAVSCIAEAYGFYRVEIKAYGLPYVVGKYTTKITELRPTIAKDKKRIEAESALSQNREFSELFEIEIEAILKEYEFALKLFQELRERDWEAITLMQIGKTYRFLQKSEQALTAYAKAAAIFRETQNLTGESEAYIYLATTYKFPLRKHDKSQQFYEKALTIKRQTGDKRNVGITLFGLGNLYLPHVGMLIPHERAIEYFEQALIMFREAKDRDNEIMVLNNLNNYFSDKNLYERAIYYLEQKLVIAKEINNKYEEANTYRALMDYYRYFLRDNKRAIFYGKQAINLFQNYKKTIKTTYKNSAAIFLAQHQGFYRRLADILISEGRFAEAQTVLDLLKEEEFRDFTVRRGGEIPDTIPYSKTEAGVAVKVDNLVKLEQERAELIKQKEKGLLSVDKQSRLDKIPAEIEVANKAFRLALDTLSKSETGSVDRISEIQSEKSLQRALSQLQKETGSNVVAIYTLLGNEDSNSAENKANKPKTKFGWIILVTPTSRKAYPIDVAELEQTVFAFRDALQSDKYDPQPLAEKLYQKLFRQTSQKQKTTLEADLETLLSGSKDKTLMWSLDGILRYVPMAALHDGKSYLVEKYRNVIFTKESFLTLTEKDKPNWKALGLGVSEQREGFSALSGVERELKDVVRNQSSKTGVIDGQIKLNKDFKEEETLRVWREGSFPVTHIASHYNFNATDPTSSFLLVGDGQLSFSEMQDKDNLFGSTDLLTLSACDTAMTSNGKEAEGFAYLAQSLGAKSVIASLWKVSDEGTPELMIRFYKQKAENPNLTKAEAFRQAQLSLLKSETKNAKTAAEQSRSDLVRVNGKKIELPLYEKTGKAQYSHPHYWSSFILIGNWR